MSCKLSPNPTSEQIFIVLSCSRYHPGGYLPTEPRKQRELSKKEKGRLVAKKEFKAAPARAELKEKRKKEKEGKRTTGKPAKKEQQVISIRPKLPF